MKQPVLSTRHAVLGCILLALTAVPVLAQTAKKTKPAAEAMPANVVTLPSPSPLYEVQIMVRAGAAQDPAGKEGTASLLGKMILEGGFGDPRNPVTKDKLAEITRPWGEAAYPEVRVDKETTTFTMTVPREVFPQFVAKVLKPMLTQPLFLENELERLRKEALVNIRSNLRFEQQELLGLLALDNWVLEGHLAAGTVKGLESVTRDDLQLFYRKNYHAQNILVAATITEPAATQLLESALPANSNVSPDNPRPKLLAYKSSVGRQVLIITQPNAIATGLHLGFPITVGRSDADYWPLFVTNVYLGLHRDSFGRMYKEIREERGYNYGDYSYIEYYAGRPYFLFPPPATPRHQQYFSIWIRPVGHQYAHFILKAMTWELDNLMKNGMTPQQVASAKQKARTLYLKYADSKSRQVGYRLDDMFYGMKDHGYLVDMLANLDKVTPEQVNAAIKKHLQVANLKYVIVTNQSGAEKLADDIANNTNVHPKTLAEYHISEPIPTEKQKMLDQDKEWVAYPLNIPRENIHIVKAEQMFETAEIPGIK